RDVKCLKHQFYRPPRFSLKLIAVSPLLINGDCGILRADMYKSIATASETLQFLIGSRCLYQLCCVPFKARHICLTKCCIYHSHYHHDNSDPRTRAKTCLHLRCQCTGCSLTM